MHNLGGCITFIYHQAFLVTFQLIVKVKLMVKANCVKHTDRIETSLRVYAAGPITKTYFL